MLRRLSQVSIMHRWLLRHRQLRIATALKHNTAGMTDVLCAVRWTCCMLAMRWPRTCSITKYGTVVTPYCSVTSSTSSASTCRRTCIKQQRQQWQNQLSESAQQRSCSGSGSGSRPGQPASTH